MSYTGLYGGKREELFLFLLVFIPRRGVRPKNLMYVRHHRSDFYLLEDQAKRFLPNLKDSLSNVEIGELTPRNRGWGARRGWEFDGCDEV